MLLALRHGTFRWLFAAQVASAFGNFAFTVAVAALLVEHGAEVVSFDRDFARFDEVRWTSPPR